MKKTIDVELLEMQAKLHGSFLLFTQTFFPLVTGREFVVSNPIGRESHFLTVAKELTKVARQQEKDLIINLPPGSGKSTLVAMWVAWTTALYPHSNFLYISYGHELAAKHTEFIKRIISHAYYSELFGVHILSDSRAKDSFKNNFGGAIKAFGSAGAVTGQDAGLPNCEHFSGAVIIDDAHKPDEAHSDTTRQRVIDNYRETILQRPRSPSVPIVYIGQRVHEDDLCAYMMSGNDERKYKPIILKALDDAGNALYPEVNPLDQLLEKKDKNPYVFASQYQQDPIPAGGGLFKRDDFILLDFDPDMLKTFITCDTAETDKSYNDATVFAFWGYYRVVENGVTTNTHALHLIDLWELRCEPKDLEENFRSFVTDCMLYAVKPSFAAIEKKSTGVTLLSVLSQLRGLAIREVKRTKASGSKAQRFLEMQPIIASKLVSLCKNSQFREKYLTHMSKITAAEVHRHDDICFVAGTKIATTFGYVPIENITTKHKVITPFGIGNVRACGSTGKHSVIKNLGLEGTPAHPVFTCDGFIPLMKQVDMVRLNHLSFKELIKWRQSHLLYSMEKNLDLRHRQDILKLVKENIETNFFIVLFGSFIQKKKYPRAIWFTIKTITNLIIVTRIWSVFRLSNIVRYILKGNRLAVPGALSWKKCGQILRKLGLRTNIKRATWRVVKNGSLLIRRSIVAFARQYLLALAPNLIYAAQNVGASGGTNGVERETLTDRSLLQFVNVAIKNLQLKICRLKNIMQAHVQDDVQGCGDIKEVYNLTVETYGVYYANNILVSNCDVTYDACKFALIDKLFGVEGGETKSIKLRTLAKAQAQRGRALS